MTTPIESGQDPIKARITEAESSGGEHLDLSNLGLKSIPDLGGQYRTLRHLNLSGNQLTSLPNWIWDLETLEDLNLTGNPLKELPLELGKLRSLRKLDLYHAELSHLPDCFTDLTQLAFLGLSRNRLTTLPPTFSSLRLLDILYMAHNQVEDVPDALRGLTDLRYLHLSNNRIADIPQWISEMTGLVELRLADNRISDIPSCIGDLDELKELVLYGNRISSLPISLGLAQSLETLDLHRNPLSSHFSIPYRAGSGGILAYLRALSRGAKPQREAKVLVLGEGETGKTTLVHRLQHGTFRSDGTSTHGIEVDHLTLGEEESLSLNFWDFGGQEVYRVTHQFFYSPRALYLLVWKPRTGAHEGAVQDWLKRIRLRAGDSARVIIVATHGDDRRPEIDLEWLRREFGSMIVASLTVDSSSGIGYDELERRIVEQSLLLDHMGMPWPDSWSQAKDKLLEIANETPQIRWVEFVKICFENGVAPDECSTLAELLDHFGHIVYWGDDPTIRDLVILQPEWLTKAISAVLEDEPTRHAGGVLKYAEVERIWGQGEVDDDLLPDHHPFFLRLMERFDVSYRIEGEFSAIVGQLLPHARPPSVAAFMERVTDLPSLHAICRLSEEPPGVMPWMVVRTNRDWLSPTVHWRRGICLERARYQSHALIEQVDPLRLDISVWAPAPDYFFHVILDTFERLAERWPGLAWELLMPCPETGSAPVRCTGSFPLSTLRKARHLGRESVTCHVCLSEVDVVGLLTGFRGFGATVEESSLTNELRGIAGHLESLQLQLSDVQRTTSLNLSSTVDIADGLRGLFRFFSHETIDTPRLVSFERLEQRKFNPKKFFQERFRAHLWCEHEDDRHRVGSYDFTASREWWVEASTYVKYAQLILRGVPVVRALADVSLAGGDEDLERADLARLGGEIHLMTAIGDINVIAPEQAALREFQTEHDLLRAGARRVRALLLDLDTSATYHGLQRTPITPTGEFFWVCDKHMKNYDPGLPALTGDDET